jgi:very-short-patch-repair endonuclease
MNADRQVRPTKSDIAIITRAIELIPNESVWNKDDNRQCPVGQTKLSLFCALQNATTEISGGIHYRQPALQAVREVLNTVDAKRIKTHRIMDYNNHPETTLSEIHTVLKNAQAALLKDIR